MIDITFTKKIIKKEKDNDVSTQRDASREEGKKENALLVFLFIFIFFILSLIFGVSNL